jgi:hypothetical protein
MPENQSLKFIVIFFKWLFLGLAQSVLLVSIFFATGAQIKLRKLNKLQ